MLTPETGVVFAFIGVITTWVIGLLTWVYGYGKLANRTSSVEHRVTNIEQAFLDANGNPRLLTVIEHRDYCDKNQFRLAEHLLSIESKIDGGQKSDTEIFKRLQAIERSTAVLETWVEIQKSNKR